MLCCGIAYGEQIKIKQKDSKQTKAFIEQKQYSPCSQIKAIQCS
jgi:hypothetical protein